MHNINSFHLQNPVVLAPCRAQETASQTLGGKNYIWNCWLNSSSIMIRYKSVVADSRHCYERVSLIWKTNQSSCFRKCELFPSNTCDGSKFLFQLWTKCQPEQKWFISSSHQQHFKKHDLVLLCFSIKSDPSTPLLPPHCHRWKTRVEKLGSQGHTCSSVGTPGDAHMARMKIFIRIERFCYQPWISYAVLTKIESISKVGHNFRSWGGSSSDL